MLSIVVECGCVTVVVDNSHKHVFNLRTHLDHVHAYHPTASSWARVMRYMTAHKSAVSVSTQNWIRLTPEQK